jgi:DNA polymerase-3 subunit alpha
MPQFSHLHVHTQYSLLDGAASIKGLMAKAKNDQMKAVAITDHGNMFGVFKFVQEAKKNQLLPVVGCEFYVVEDRFRKSFTGGKKDKRYHQLMLAKNATGYQNLSKLCSLGFLDGLYSKYPRIDKELVKKYKEGIIATTCCIGAEVPQAIIFKGEEEGERVFKEWLDIFGEDYYIELQRHHIADIDGTGVSQEDVNQILLKWSEKYNVPVIATNDSHYVEEEDWNAHDILLCINTGDKQTPDEGKKRSFKFPNSEFYFKTQAEMEQLFHDIPQALDNTNLITDKIQPLELERDVLLPSFSLPEQFANQDDYLRHLTYEGAKRRYGSLTQDIIDRLDFELNTIKESGYPGYFLIVQDFTTVARNLGVSVGPGRGSAAGSAVAYCIGITNVDPIKYNLLFERFLNPERVSLPDIDIDFDDVGRQKVLDYVVDKYGKNQVAQIITYGSMAAKSSIRDVGRVLDLPLDEVSKVAKLVPNISLNKALKTDTKDLKDDLNAEELDNLGRLKKIASGNDLAAEVINQAVLLEGSVRNTGVHACGVIIAPTEISNIIPVTKPKDSDLLLTQYDNSVVEDAGLLKMDFLGLKTLSIINDAISIVKERHGIEIDPDEIPLDDEKTYELYQRGATTATFQFESGGMQQHLKNLKPDKFDDLIAMNALYRPGPMEYIGDFIDRKHGRKPIEYDLSAMREFLEETYGITVYQEQVMLLSQKLAGFSKGEADSLRKAMGKKKIAEMDRLYPKYLNGCEENGHDLEIAKKVWKDWEEFAKYAFNKSHATCYSVVAFQTGYLKANYPAEYMASVLGNNMNDIKKVTLFMEECRRMGVEVLGPDVNESNYRFTVNEKGQIRFGMGAVKGVGESVVEAMVTERKENGPFKNIFDLCSRVNLKNLNKKALESLAKAGAFDFDENYHRAQYFQVHDGHMGLELALKYGHSVQEQKNSAQASLFGEASSESFAEPTLPETTEMETLEVLNLEKEVVGVYISNHPLDIYRVESNLLITQSCSSLKNLHNNVGKKNIYICGMVSAASHLTTKRGVPFGKFELEDYTDKFEVVLFKEDYLNYKQYLQNGLFLMINGSVVQEQWRPDPSFKVQNMFQLEAAIEKMVDEVQLFVYLQDIDPLLIHDTEVVFKANPGKVPVTFLIQDKEEKYNIQLTSTKYKIDLNNDIMDFITNKDLKVNIIRK